MAFWALDLQPGEHYSLNLPYPVKINQAALTAEVEDTTSKTVLQCTVDESTFTLCSLRHNIAEQFPLRLILQPGENIKLFTTGKNAIHVSGTILPFDDDDDDDDDDNDAILRRLMADDNDVEDDDEDDEDFDLMADDDDEEIYEEGESEEDESEFKGRIEELHDAEPAELTAQNGATDDKKRKQQEIEGQPSKKAKKVEQQPKSDQTQKKNQKKNQKPKKQVNQNNETEKSATKTLSSSDISKSPKQQRSSENNGIQSNDSAKFVPVKRKLPSGLEYEVVKLGEGRKASPGSKVSVKYLGKLEKSGKVFDKGHFSFRLGLGEVIKGWDQGVSGMSVGEKRKLRIPAQLGYGKKGAPPDIPPNANLVFDVELTKA